MTAKRFSFFKRTEAQMHLLEILCTGMNDDGPSGSKSLWHHTSTPGQILCRYDTFCIQLKTAKVSCLLVPSTIKKKVMKNLITPGRMSSPRCLSLYLCSENKGADLRLCFRICKMLVFS